MKAIYRKSSKSYFQSMIGYAFIAFLLAFVGIYFMAYNLNAGYPYFSYALSGVMFMFLVAVPILTMKSFSEERKSKTDQLLLTSPVRLVDVVLGKYLAMVTVFLTPNLIFCIYPLVIKMQGTAYLRVDYAAILMFFYTWLCLHSNRNVFICVDRKPDYRSGKYFCSASHFTSVGRIVRFYPEYGNQWSDWNNRNYHDCGVDYIPVDKKLGYQRGDRSNWSDCMCRYIRCEIIFV